MKRVFNYIAGRWFEARAERALDRYLALSARAEVFFARIGVKK